MEKIPTQNTPEKPEFIDFPVETFRKFFSTVQFGGVFGYSELMANTKDLSTVTSIKKKKLETEVGVWRKVEIYQLYVDQPPIWVANVELCFPKDEDMHILAAISS